MTDVSHLLSQIEQGDPSAAEELLPLVYQELRRLAAHRIAREAPGGTLDATGLVHEAYLRLVDVPVTQHWDGRGHFFAAAAEAMRRILVDHARRRGAIKRGGDRQRVALEDVPATDAPPVDDLLAIDEALTRLAAQDAAKAELVKLHFFAGLTLEESAEILGISLATAKRRWTYARAWLYDQLHGEAPSE